MPKRPKKSYSKPRKPYDKTRIEEENSLMEKYGLKNKREIWKADAAIRRIRRLAKALITKSEEEKKNFIEKLQKKGFDVKNIADVLALDKEYWLKRRLQTIVFFKKLAFTPKHARQLIVHKHVLVGDSVVNIPSYQVSLEEEPLVRLKKQFKTSEQKNLEIEKEGNKKEELIEEKNE